MPANRNRIDAALAALLLLAAGVIVTLLYAPVRAQNGAQLSIPHLSIPAGQAKVTVPVNFDPGEEAVAAIIFSLDLETTCLRLPLTDADRDGRPDAVAILTSDAFQSTVSYSAADTTGEIDFSIADWSIPFTVVPAGTLVTLTYDVLCAPDPTQATRVVPLPFSTAPQPSFGDTEGNSAPGTWQSGTLTIVNPATVTPTNVPTATNTPVTPPPTATNTPVTPPPTATNTPIGGPTATNTPVPPPTATKTPVPPPTATHTPTTEPPICEDNDGVGNEPPGDADGDGKPNCRDADDDGDAIPTLIEGNGDPDHDGIPSYLDGDSNNNGIPDAVEVGPDPLHPVDADHNGTYDFLQMPAIFLPLVHR